tara:strand:- start:69 stop:842 length:774 start_codon:yes stop_codon:yes gene_type:complete
MSSGGNINPLDIFSKMFGGGMSGNMENPNEMFPGVDPMFPFAGGMGHKIHIFKAGNMPFPDFDKMGGPIEEPDTIEVNINLSLYESYSGCDKPIEVNRYIVKNNKKYYEKETIYVNFYKGIDNNECIVLSNKGNVINDQYGDIKVRVRLAFKENYERNGLNLVYTKKLLLQEAFCGFSFLYEHLNGKSYKINHNGEYIIQPGYKKEINGLGFIREENVGNLIINFQIVFPENLSLDVRKQISELLIVKRNEEEIENK